MTASEQWQVIINAEPSPILWTWEHCASILCNRAEQLDRSHPRIFMDYMRDNPWYFREAFGIPWSEGAAREEFWKMDRRGRS
jgi:hypothetical protein